MANHKATPDAKRANEHADTCRADIPKPPVDTLAPGAPVLPCDPTPPPVVPDTFTLPTADPKQRPDAGALPAPVTLSCNAATVTCDADQVGDPFTYTVEEHSIQDTLYIDTVNGVNVEDLLRIGILPNIVDILNDAAASTHVHASVGSIANTLVARLDLPAASAMAIAVVMRDLQDSLDTQAQFLAEGSISCTYGNDELWVYCDIQTGEGIVVFTDPNLQPDAEGRPAQDVTHVAHATYTSANSIAEANATAAAEYACVYWNTDVSVVCSTDTPEDILEYHNVVIHTMGGEEETLIRKYTVQAGTVSGASTDEANLIARTLAMAELNCIFPSDPVVLTCASEEGGSIYVTPDNEPYLINPVGSDNGKAIVYDADGNYVGIPGKSVSLPGGFFASESDAASATASARALAESLLDCFWENPEIRCMCDLGYSDSLSEVPKHAIEAGSIISYTGTVGIFTDAQKATVDDQYAMTIETIVILCESSLDCIYCNEPIEGDCPLPSYPKPPVSLDGDTVIDEQGTVATAYAPTRDNMAPIDENAITSEWSLNVTLGIGPRVFCSPIKESAEALARVTSLIEGKDKAKAKQCYYGNVSVTVSCHTDAIENGADLAVGLHSSSSAPIVIAANTVQVSIDDYEEALESGNMPSEVVSAKTYATYLAKRMGISYLTCMYTNAPVVVLCFRDNSPGHADDLPSGVRVDNYSEASPYAGGSTTTVQAQTISLSAADMALYNSSTASPILEVPVYVYGDGAMTSVDGKRMLVSEASTGAIGSEVVVPYGTVVTTDGIDAANAMAFVMASGQLQCLWKSPEIHMYCDKPNMGEYAEYAEESSHVSGVSDYSPGYRPAGGDVSHSFELTITDGGKRYLGRGVLRPEWPEQYDYPYSAIGGKGTASPGVAPSWANAKWDYSASSIRSADMGGRPQWQPYVLTKFWREAGEADAYMDVVETPKGGIINPVIVAAGVGESTTSFKAAIATAIAIGEAQLDCWVSHEPMTATCDTLSAERDERVVAEGLAAYCGSVAGSYEELLTDYYHTWEAEEPGLAASCPTGASKVDGRWPGGLSPCAVTPTHTDGSVYISYKSFLDAGRMARADAESRLICLYTNTAVCACCGRAPKKDQGWNPNTRSWTVPQGYVTAASVREATTIAVTLAMSRRVCIPESLEGGLEAGLVRCANAPTIEVKVDREDDELTYTLVKWTASGSIRWELMGETDGGIAVATATGTGNEGLWFVITGSIDKKTGSASISCSTEKDSCSTGGETVKFEFDGDDGAWSKTKVLVFCAVGSASDKEAIIFMNQCGALLLKVMCDTKTRKLVVAM